MAVDASIDKPHLLTPSEKIYLIAMVQYEQQRQIKRIIYKDPWAKTASEMDMGLLRMTNIILWKVRKLPCQKS